MVFDYCLVFGFSTRTQRIYAIVCLATERSNAWSFCINPIYVISVDIYIYRTHTWAHPFWLAALNYTSFCAWILIRCQKVKHVKVQSIRHSANSQPGSLYRTMNGEKHNNFLMIALKVSCGYFFSVQGRIDRACATVVGVGSSWPYMSYCCTPHSNCFVEYHAVSWCCDITIAHAYWTLHIREFWRRWIGRSTKIEIIMWLLYVAWIFFFTSNDWAHYT